MRALKMTDDDDDRCQRPLLVFPPPPYIMCVQAGSKNTINNCIKLLVSIKTYTHNMYTSTLCTAISQVNMAYLPVAPKSQGVNGRMPS